MVIQPSKQRRGLEVSQMVRSPSRASLRCGLFRPVPGIQLSKRCVVTKARSRAPGQHSALMADTRERPNSLLSQDHFREEYDSWNCDHGQDRGQGEYLRGVGVVLFVADRHHGSGGGSRACGRDKYSLRHLKGKSHQFQDEDHHQREDEQFDCRYKIQPYIAEHFADVRLGHGESGDHHGQRGVHIRHILQGIQKDCRNPDLSKE